jgi:hypothetical protein
MRCAPRSGRAGGPGRRPGRPRPSPRSRRRVTSTRSGSRCRDMLRQHQHADSELSGVRSARAAVRRPGCGAGWCRDTIRGRRGEVTSWARWCDWLSARATSAVATSATSWAQSRLHREPGSVLDHERGEPPCTTRSRQSQRWLSFVSRATVASGTSPSRATTPLDGNEGGPVGEREGEPGDGRRGGAGSAVEPDPRAGRSRAPRLGEDQTARPAARRRPAPGAGRHRHTGDHGEQTYRRDQRGSSGWGNAARDAACSARLSPGQSGSGQRSP